MQEDRSVLSLAEYLLDVAPVLASSTDRAQTTSLSENLISRPWRLDALPLDIEEHEDRLFEKWFLEW